jgi:predicted DNA binding protein
MTAESVHFRVRHDTPLAAFTAQRPGMALAVWCNWEFDVYELSGASAEDAAALCEVLQLPADHTEVHAFDERVHVVVGACAEVDHGSAVMSIDEARCLNVPPARFHQGWEDCQMVSFSEEKTRAVFAQLRKSGAEVEIVTKRPLNRQALLAHDGPAMAALFDPLTDKQGEAVVLAHRHGLYTSPRRTTAAAIADATGVSRSTFEEHLRKAENSLLGALAPYLELHVRTRAKRRGEEKPPLAPTK